MLTNAHYVPVGQWSPSMLLCLVGRAQFSNTERGDGIGRALESTVRTREHVPHNVQLAQRATRQGRGDSAPCQLHTSRGLGMKAVAQSQYYSIRRWYTGPPIANQCIC